jgi:hypothetical protein
MEFRQRTAPDRAPVLQVVGYKPQLARSGNGFVSALVVPEGNAADSAMLMPLASAAIGNLDEVAVTVALAGCMAKLGFSVLPVRQRSLAATPTGASPP